MRPPIRSKPLQAAKESPLKNAVTSLLAGASLIAALTAGLFASAEYNPSDYRATAAEPVRARAVEPKRADRISTRLRALQFERAPYCTPRVAPVPRTAPLNRG